MRLSSFLLVSTFLAGGSCTAVAGEVRVWGTASAPASVINVPAGLSDAVQIASGNTFAAALKADGSVVVWGDNPFSGANILTVPVTAQSHVTAISAGGTYLLALRDDGTVVSWGDTTKDGVQVSGWSNVAQISASTFTSCGLTASGTVLLANGGSPEAPAGTYVDAQVTGTTLLVQDSSGAVSASTSELTLGAFAPPIGLVSERLIPSKYGSGISSFPPIGGALRASDHVVVLWGNDRSHMIADLPIGLTASQAMIGAYHAVAVTLDSSIRIWGDGPNGDTAYFPPKGWRGATQVDVGVQFTTALFSAAPIGISLSGSTAAELTPVGTVIGTLSATAQTLGEAFTFSLVSGVGDTDNGLVRISGNELQVNSAWDFETHRTLTVRIQAIETSSGHITSDAFALQVLNSTQDDPKKKSDSGCGLGSGIGLVLLGLGVALRAKWAGKRKS